MVKISTSKDVCYWLLKTEPTTYSFETLLKDRKTAWNGVRNFQARNFLKEMKEGDIALIYHSGGKAPEIVGIAEVTRTAYPDPDPSHPGDWVQVDIKPLQSLKKPVSLQHLKATPSLSELKLLRQSRLSVMPVSKSHFKIILKLGGGTE